MRRLISTLACDAKLQYRNGFYYAAAFVAFFWMLLLWQFEPETTRWLLPLFVLSNLLMNTFYFVAGLVLLEKREGTLAAQVVTPLRDWEYLASKAATLTALALAENFLIAGVATRGNFNPAALAAGLAAAAGMLTLFGFVAVSRYDSVNEFLFPSALYSMATLPPFLQYIGLWRSPLAYLHPLQGPLMMTSAAFEPVGVWVWVYGVAASAFWLWLLSLWSRRIFARFVVRGEGVRR